MTDKPKTPGAMVLACPFCGCKETQERHDDGYCWTECMGCHATGPGGTKYSDEESPNWNTRAPAEQTPAVGLDQPSWQKGYDTAQHVIDKLESELRITKQALNSLKGERADANSWQHLKPSMNPSPLD